ncbi:Hsp20/alpha crystallin family protein [Streptomyces hoynatensis]|uniref:Hsp20/alpha crystallin family protein n=1 Tax=Streptomyces hoynatensis TaxID=1141874 RepID=A0A3A9YZ54_9ACTN|nr:Hsp20/alpha crystallin family protein [Streptomyces hoynatensis]RKN40527.1 Hsp20/alpha crystallin family protein [Streptomyces hoynatensis]
MLMRTDPFRDPFREFDRLADRLFGTASAPVGMPMDAYRSGEEVVVHFDLPGVDPESIDVDVERNVLTVTAERTSPAPEGSQALATERPRGRFSRQLFLGETLDSERIDAAYDAGVLTLRIPLAEQAKARKIPISGGKRKALTR